MDYRMARGGTRVGVQRRPLILPWKQMEDQQQASGNGTNSTDPVEQAQPPPPQSPQPTAPSRHSDEYMAISQLMRRRFQLMINIRPIHIRYLVPEKVRRALDVEEEFGQNMIYSQTLTLLKHYTGQHPVYEQEQCQNKHITFCIKIMNHINDYTPHVPYDQRRHHHHERHTDISQPDHNDNRAVGDEEEEEEEAARKKWERDERQRYELNVAIGGCTHLIWLVLCRSKRSATDDSAINTLRLIYPRGEGGGTFFPLDSVRNIHVYNAHNFPACLDFYLWAINDLSTGYNITPIRGNNFLIPTFSKSMHAVRKRIPSCYQSYLNERCRCVDALLKQYCIESLCEDLNSFVYDTRTIRGIDVHQRCYDLNETFPATARPDVFNIIERHLQSKVQSFGARNVIFFANYVSSNEEEDRLLGHFTIESVWRVDTEVAFMNSEVLASYCSLAEHGHWADGGRIDENYGQQMDSFVRYHFTETIQLVLLPTSRAVLETIANLLQYGIYHPRALNPLIASLRDRHIHHPLNEALHLIYIGLDLKCKELMRFGMLLLDPIIWMGQLNDDELLTVLRVCMMNECLADIGSVALLMCLAIYHFNNGFYYWEPPSTQYTRELIRLIGEEVCFQMDAFGSPHFKNVTRLGCFMRWYLAATGPIFTDVHVQNFALANPTNTVTAADLPDDTERYLFDDKFPIFNGYEPLCAEVVMPQPYRDEEQPPCLRQEGWPVVSHFRNIKIASAAVFEQRRRSAYRLVQPFRKPYLPPFYPPMPRARYTAIEQQQQRRGRWTEVINRRHYYLYQQPYHFSSGGVDCGGGGGSGCGGEDVDRSVAPTRIPKPTTTEEEEKRRKRKYVPSSVRTAAMTMTIKKKNDEEEKKKKIRHATTTTKGGVVVRTAITHPSIHRPNVDQREILYEEEEEDEDQEYDNDEEEREEDKRRDEGDGDDVVFIILDDEEQYIAVEDAAAVAAGNTTPSTLTAEDNGRRDEDEDEEEEEEARQGDELRNTDNVMTMMIQPLYETPKSSRQRVGQSRPTILAKKTAPLWNEHDYGTRSL